MHIVIHCDIKKGYIILKGNMFILTQFKKEHYLISLNIYALLTILSVVQSC